MRFRINLLNVLRASILYKTSFCNCTKAYCITSMSTQIKSVSCFKEVVDRYQGVTVDTSKFQLPPDEFEASLLVVLEEWQKNGVRGVWFKVQLNDAPYIPALVKNGFTFHHAKKSYAMLTRWLPKDETDLLPQFPHTHVGVGGLVVNEANQVLVIKERFQEKYWKLPGGYSNPGEEFADTAKREVLEETGISTEFVSVVSLRHHHKHIFHCSDIYVVCHMRPLDKHINKSIEEIADCQWMNIEDYQNHAEVSDFNKFVVKSFLESQKLGAAIIPTSVISILKDRYTSTYAVKPSNSDTRYLITGTRFRQLAFSFRISKSAVASIVIEVCKAIWKMMKDIHMPQPTTECYEKIADAFWEKWQFPNCIGSIDLKHIKIKCPPNSGSMYYCHHNFYSIGLLTVTDANYKFIVVNVGSYGKENDAGVFDNAPFQHAIESGHIKFPEDRCLPGSNIKAPFVMLGDEAFPLLDYLLRPFPKSKKENAYFNYRLCRGRMVVECSYGAIVAKFNVLAKAIETKVENAVHIVKAITLLHNIIKDKESINIDACSNNAPQFSQATKAHNAATRQAITTRKMYTSYFKSHPLATSAN